MAGLQIRYARYDQEMITNCQVEIRDGPELENAAVAHIAADLIAGIGVMIVNVDQFKLGICSLKNFLQRMLTTYPMIDGWQRFTTNQIIYRSRN